MGLRKVIAGGQTGVDQAAWRAARAAGIATGGWMPAGYWTEAGPRPDFAAEYGAVALEGPSLAASVRGRTRMNVRDSDAVLWLGDADSPGGRATLGDADRMGKPRLVVPYGGRPRDVLAWLDATNPGVLDVAGNRESTAPGIGERAERFLAAVFRRPGPGQVVAGRP